MSTQPPPSNPLHQYGHHARSVRHSKDRALSEREFELLLEGARTLKGSRWYYDADPELVIYALGRLGLRRGELAHMTEDWLDWRESMIQIPAHEPCSKGDDGGPCGMCRQSAKQRVEYADELELDEALSWTWTPKTEAAVRDVHFGHDVRAEIYLERYFEPEDVTQVAISGASISRRVADAAEAAEELSPDDVHPHSLRATAASYLAGRIGVYQLMQMFGWVKSATAERYISRSSTRTAQQLNGIYTR